MGVLLPVPVVLLLGEGGNRVIVVVVEVLFVGAVVCSDLLLLVGYCCGIIK